MSNDNATTDASHPPAVGAPVERGVGRLAPERVTLVCVLEQQRYRPGDQAPEGYLAWHEWAEVQHKAGLRQKQCGRCGLWRYPQQLSEHMVRWQGFTARGKPAHQMAPLCLKCEARRKTPNVRANLRAEGPSS